MGIPRLCISWRNHILFGCSSANGTKLTAIVSSFKDIFACVGIETAAPLSFGHSLGSQGTLQLHACGLAMMDQWPGGLWGQEMFLWGDFGKEE